MSQGPVLVLNSVIVVIYAIQKKDNLEELAEGRTISQVMRGGLGRLGGRGGGGG